MSMFQVYYQHIVSAFKYIASAYVIVVTPYQNQVKAWAILTKTIMVPNYNQVFDKLRIYTCYCQASI